MTVIQSLLAGILVAGAGAVLGAFFARRNAREAHADKLLTEALNDLVTSIADVASGDQGAQRRYASAISRIVLHGSPGLVAVFAEFQHNATTATSEGRQRLIAALQVARHELGRPDVDESAAALLLFGPHADHPQPSAGTAQSQPATGSSATSWRR